MVMVANCPIMWLSKLQSETTLSTMEAEIIALVQRFCKLFLIINGVSIMGKAIGLPVGNTTIQVLIHKDYVAALVLAKTLIPQFTSQRKHYQTKTIWIQEKIVKGRIILLKICTT